MVMRITGLTSGMDIDSMVKKLMDAERIPYNKTIQKRDLLDFKMNSYRDVNLKLSSFRDSLQTFKLSSNLLGSKFSSSDSTKVTVSGSVTQSVSHTIEVSALASNAIKTSLAGVSKVGLTGNALPATTNITTGVNDTLNISLNGVARAITLDAGSYDPSQLQSQLQSKIDQAFGSNRIQASLTAGNAISLDAIGTAGSLPPITISDGNGGLGSLGFSGKQSSKLDITAPISQIANSFNTALSIPAASDSFKINGVSISYSSSDSVQDIMNKVNQSSAGVTMSYDGVSDRFTFTSRTTGAASQIKLEKVSGNFLDSINVDLSVATGTDAQVTIDGVTSARDSNSFSINGVTYNIYDKTTSPVTVKADRDIDDMVNKIKDFVKSYNDTLELVNTKLSEQKVKGYDPLTADQKQAMKDNDIQLWEDKVKTGLLHNDSTISKVRSDLRSVLTTSVNGIPQDYNSLYKIGLTTAKFVQGSYDPKDAGKIVIDETKLRQALEQDADSVVNLFTAYSADPSSKGIAHQLYDSLNNSISEITRKAGRSGGSLMDASTELGRQYTDLQMNVLSWDDKLSKKEDQYYKQFSAMESAMEKSNSQIAWLSQQFG